MPRTASPAINGAAIREFRRLLNVSQKDLAKDALISPQYLADIERGARNASSPVAGRIASKLGVSVEAIVPRAAA